jgi:hypothetical protein
MLSKTILGAFILLLGGMSTLVAGETTAPKSPANPSPPVTAAPVPEDASCTPTQTVAEPYDFKGIKLGISIDQFRATPGVLWLVEANSSPVCKTPALPTLLPRYHSRNEGYSSSIIKIDLVWVSREQVAALLARNKAPTLRQVDQPSLRHVKLGPMNPIVKNFLSPTGEKLIALLGSYS